MKKYSLIMMSVAAAAMAFISCEKVNEEDAPAAPSEGTIPVSISTGEIETKTSYDPEAKKIYWIKEDEIGVVPEDAKENFQFTQTAYDGTKTTTIFTGTVKEAGKHYAYHPYSAYMTIGTGPRVSLSDWQVMPSTGSFDANADILVSEEFNVAASGSNSFDKLRFRRLGAFIDIQFKAGPSLTLDLTSESLTSVTITAESDLVGDRVLDPKTGVFGAISDGSHSVYVGRAASALVYSSHTFAGVYPQTLAEGSKLIIEADLNHHKIHKEVTVPTGGITLKAGHIQPLKINLNDADFVPVITREWKKTPMGLGSPWTDYLTVGKDYIKGNDRNMAMDDKYIYIAGAHDTKKGVIAINKDDPSDIKEVDMTGVSGGHFATSCVRTIWDPTTSKWILLLGSLAFDNDFTFKVYAYLDGYDKAPTLVKSWATSSRRFGDTFTVVGDWSNGELWIRINGEASTTIFFRIKDGVLGDPIGGPIGYGPSFGMGSCYKYSLDATQFLLETPSIGLIYNYTASTYIESASGVVWAVTDQTAMLRKYGVTPFTYNGKNYIAYVYIGKKSSATEKNGARGRLKIIEDLGGASNFLASIEADKVVYECPIQNDNSNATTVEEFDYVPYSDNPSIATTVLGSCSVIPVGGDVYIAGHICNVGLSLFKMTL